MISKTLSALKKNTIVGYFKYKLNYLFSENAQLTGNQRNKNNSHKIYD